MGRSRPASSAAAALEKLVTRTAFSPKRSTARRTWRERFVVFPVPDSRRAEDTVFPHIFGPRLRVFLDLIWVQHDWFA
jgi:hypothetical protein